jgi:hypothetical protein
MLSSKELSAATILSPTLLESPLGFLLKLRVLNLSSRVLGKGFLIYFLFSFIVSLLLALKQALDSLLVNALLS